MLQDTITYGPVKAALPDSIQQGIPPYADVNTKPSDSLFAQLALNPFAKTIENIRVSGHNKHSTLHTEKSIFNGNLLQPDKSSPSLINETAYNWLTVVLLISFAIYTATQFLYGKRIGQIFKAGLSRRYMNQLVRDGGLFGERITIGLMFIFFTTSTTIIFQFIQFKSGVLLKYPEATFAAIFGGLFLFWLLKIATINFLGHIFKTETSAAEYNLTGLIYLEINGLILLPIALAAVFRDPIFFSTTGLVIILLSITLNLFRGFLVGLSNTKFSFLYLILYLCALEILPLAVVAKIFILH
jgi:hypothetical protein